MTKMVKTPKDGDKWLIGRIRHTRGVKVPLSRYLLITNQRCDRK